MSDKNWVSTGGNIGTDTTISCATPTLTFELLDISPPGAEAKTIDMTHMGSTLYKEYLPGKIIEWGECEFEVAYDPGESGYDPETLLTDTDEDSTWTIAFPYEEEGEVTQFTNWVFKGYVSNVGVKTPLEDRITATITIQVSEWVSPEFQEVGS